MFKKKKRVAGEVKKKKKKGNLPQACGVLSRLIDKDMKRPSGRGRWEDFSEEKKAGL